MSIFRLLLLTVLAMALAGCGSSPTVIPDEVAETNGLPPRSDGGLPTRPAATAGATSPPDDDAQVEALTDFEEAMADTWRRWQVRNAGSDNEWGYYEYIGFNEDRTACRWKYGQDSSSSYTDDLFDSTDYEHWAITQELSGGNEFRVEVEGSGLDYEFDFVADRIYPAGFETLVFSRTTDGKSCFVRDGPSY